MNVDSKSVFGKTLLTPVTEQEADRSRKAHQANKQQTVPKDEEKEEHVVRLLLKMERQMAVVRCALVQVWMMKETMQIIGATQDVSRDFAHQQAQIPDPAKKEELGPLHIRIWERWIVELQKHYQLMKENDPSVQANVALAKRPRR